MMKGLNDVLRQGIKLVFRKSKFLWLLIGTNIVFAILLSLPIYYILNDNLQNSIINIKLASGFDYLWYIQFRELYKITIGEIPYMIYASVGIYILIQVFYLGGIISLFNIPAKDHYVDFFYGGVKYWYRFTKILLVSLAIYAVAFLLNDLLGYIITFFFINREQQIIEFILRASRYVLLIFFIGVVSIISDYSKVYVALKDTTKILPGIFHSIIFIKRNFNRLFIVFFIIAVIGAAGAIIYNLLNGFIPRTNVVYFLTAFILQQLLIIFRLFVRMLFSSTEVILFKDLNAELISIKVEEVV